MLVDEKNGSRKIASTRQGAVSVLRCIDNWVIPLSWHLAVRSQIMRLRLGLELAGWLKPHTMAGVPRLTIPSQHILILNFLNKALVSLLFKNIFLTHTTESFNYFNFHCVLWVQNYLFINLKIHDWVTSLNFHLHQISITYSDWSLTSLGVSICTSKACPNFLLSAYFFGSNFLFYIFQCQRNYCLIWPPSLLTFGQHVLIGMPFSLMKQYTFFFFF